MNHALGTFASVVTAIERSLIILAGIAVVFIFDELFGGDDK